MWMADCQSITMDEHEIKTEPVARKNSLKKYTSTEIRAQSIAAKANRSLETPQMDCLTTLLCASIWQQTLELVYIFMLLYMGIILCAVFDSTAMRVQSSKQPKTHINNIHIYPYGLKTGPAN